MSKFFLKNTLALALLVVFILFVVQFLSHIKAQERAREQIRNCVEDLNKSALAKNEIVNILNHYEHCVNQKEKI